MTVDGDLYEVLDVSSNASAEGIQDAYYRQVRKHPPEKDAEGFGRLQAAYEILKSPEARREYDEARGGDPETAQLIEEGRQLLENQDSEAVKPLMRAIARRPESLVVSDLLVQAFMVAGQERSAARLAKRLIDREPNSSTYHLRLAQAYRGMDRDADALRPLETAVRLAKDDPLPTIELAYLYRDLDCVERAVELLTSAIHHDGSVDFEDFIFFQTLCRIYVGMGELAELQRIHRRISDILPPDRDTRAYVAWSYYTDALAMARAGHYSAGLKTIEEAAAIDDSLPDLHAIRKQLRNFHDLVMQYEVLVGDQRIDGALRMAVGGQVFRLLYGESEEIETSLDQAMDAVLRQAKMENSRLLDSVAIIRQRYLRVAEVVAEWLGNLEEFTKTATKPYRLVNCYNCQAEMVLEKPSATDSVQQRHRYFGCDECGAAVDQYGERFQPPETSTSSGCFVVTAACGSELAYPVVVLRRFRDERMNECAVGRLAIWSYSRIGPSLARVIRSNEMLRRWTYWVVVRAAHVVDG